MAQQSYSSCIYAIAGIGGSHLGPKMCVEALKAFAIGDLKFHFISSIDKVGLDDVLMHVDPEETLFIISSKTFSTIETLTNANTIRQWMEAKLGQTAVKQHFIAITTAQQKALAFGIAETNILPLWDWVGGRYSIWSAIGLPLMLQIGTTHFNDFLQGAFEIDQHFQEAAFSENIPVLMGLLSIWNTNFFGASAHAIIPYAHRLRYLIAYLQQAEMESNGKSMSLAGNPVAYATGSVIFGEEGCNGQHAYHQLLLQGKHLIPADFILIGKSERGTFDQHQAILLASAISQATALMRGKTYEEAYQESNPDDVAETRAMIAKHRIIPGNKPSNILFLECLSPKTLGALLALYEHTIFVQSAIWNINPFDQWGVELGKQLLPEVLEQVKSAQPSDQTITNLIAYLRKIKAEYA